MGRARAGKVLGWVGVLSLLLALPASGQDIDADGAMAPGDNCPTWPNPLQEDADGNGIGDACECGDQNGDRRVDVGDLIAINRAIFAPALRTALCDTDFDGDCDVLDLVGAWRKIFGARAHCGRYPPPGVGPSAFVSAPPEAAPLAELFAPADPRTAAPTDTTAAQQRTVEEGDIYRVLGAGRILNLNAYRGLQVIDVSDVERPRIIGRLAVSGSPVEMYVVGPRVFVLLNSWTGYYGRLGTPALDSHRGGVVLAIDLADPTAPALLDRARIPGAIETSRLTRAGERAALYVASSGHAEWERPDGSRAWETRTAVLGFDVSAGALEKRSQIDLGGYVADIQATFEALLVARNDWVSPFQGTRVSLIDIRDPGGLMVAGGEVIAEGWVRSQFNMDLYQGVLRVVSSDPYARHNVVQTWDASDFHALEPIDRAVFGTGQDLFATLFLGHKAFFVTFLRIDPFHAFSIDASGAIEQRAEFEVSGWNDFFRAVAGETRLIGIGVDDQSGRSAAVSLYDITDLANSDPLLARAVVEAESTWSEASFDHRAFSVLEGAVDVTGPGGARETGLVLLPFSGWTGETYSASVQLFTFGSRTVTRRGRMDHGSPVRRSFLAEAATAANLSEDELSLFDVADPDRPEEQGRLELAPSYTRLLFYGEHAARVKDSTTYLRGWWGDRAQLPPATVEIIRRAEHPDRAEALAGFSIPGHAAVHQVGELLVALAQEPLVWPEARTEIAVWDLSAPTSPSLVATLVTDRLEWVASQYPRWICRGCDLRVPLALPIAGPTPGSVGVVPGALVFLEEEPDRVARRHVLEILDLTTPSAPALTEPIDLGSEGWDFSLRTHGSNAWVSSVRSAAIEGDSRTFVQHFLQRIDLARPSLPRIAAPINVAGRLVAIEGDDLYTRDTTWGWGETRADTRVARSRLRSGLASLEAQRVFEDQVVDAVLLDGAGHVLVGHHALSVYPAIGEAALYGPPQHLSVLEALGLDRLAEVEIDVLARLRHALAGRALFEVPGGVLVFNLDEPTRPFPQAFFPAQGFPRQILVDAGRILVPAERHGIHVFALDEFNLLSPQSAGGD